MELKYKNWKDININTYIKLKELLEHKITDVESNVDLNVRLLSILCDVDEDIIANLQLDKFVKLLKQSMFLNDMPKVEIKDNYDINGKKYNVHLNMSDMTISQYIDFQTFCKDRDKYLKEIIACFLIPSGKKYCDGYNVNDVINDIGNYFSIIDAYAICFFFTLSFQSLTKTTLNYLVKKMKKQMKKMTQEQKMKTQEAIDKMKQVMDLVKNGDGFIG